VTIAELRAAKYAEPFRPFRLMLADGRSVLVEHPTAIAWSGKQGQTIVVMVEQSAAVFDLDQITDLVVEPGGQAEGGGK
jgi:hypothetical protein